jgi:hypothetical protein
LGLFVALVALIISTNQPVSETPPLLLSTPTLEATAAPTGTLLRVFPDLRVLDIQAIRLQDISSGSQLTLARDSAGNWTAPDVAGELDENAASDIARTLALFPYTRSLNIVEATDFADYGLAPNPRLLFQMLKANGSSHVIALGSLTESGVAYYAIVDERDEIFLVERGPVDFLETLIFSPPTRLTN